MAVSERALQWEITPYRRDGKVLYTVEIFDEDGNIFSETSGLDSIANALNWARQQFDAPRNEGDGNGN